MRYVLLVFFLLCVCGQVLLTSSFPTHVFNESGVIDNELIAAGSGVTTPAPTEASSDSGYNAGVIVCFVVAGIFACIFVLFCCKLCCRNRDPY
jgi:hypothetical protein